jgi:group I intron endonuclease
MEKNNVVYCILNVLNGKKYIGSAINFRKRKNVHLHHLRNKTHHSISLQRSFNKHGENYFKFFILEDMISDELHHNREQFYIDFYKSANKLYGYNICPMVNSTKNRKVNQSTKEKIKFANLGKKHKLETIEKLKIIHKGLHLGNKNGMYGKIGELSPNFGRKHTKEFCQKITDRQIGENNPFAKLTWNIVKEIRNIYPKYSMSFLAKKYKVSRKCISKVLNNHTWIEK